MSRAGPALYGTSSTRLWQAAEKCAANDNGLVATWGFMATQNGACGVYPLPSPWYGGINNFRWTNRKIRELGGHSNYYVQGHLISPGYHRDNTFLGNLPARIRRGNRLARIARQGLLRARIASSPPTGPRLRPICMLRGCRHPKKEFNNYLGDWALRFLGDYAADGIYFDGFAIGSALPSVNYDDASSTTGDLGRGQLADPPLQGGGAR